MKIPLRQRYRHQLAFRVVAVFSLLLLAAAAACGIILRYFVQSDLEDQTRREMIHAVTRLESDLARLGAEVSLMAQLSARASQVEDPRAQLGAKTLQITVLEESRLQGIEIDEFVAGHTDTPDIEVLRRGFSGMGTIDYILWGEGQGKLHIMAVSPVETGGTERKVIAASLSLGREFLRKQKEIIGSDISLLTEEGLLASSSPCIECQECLKTIVKRDTEWRKLASGQTLYVTFDCEPESQAAILFPIRTFGGEPVAVAVFRSRADEIHALRRATLGIVGGGLGFSLAMGAAFFLLFSRVIHPLRELARLTAGASTGRYGETVPVRGEDEVGDLALAFNRMSISLKEAAKEIADLRAFARAHEEDRSDLRINDVIRDALALLDKQLGEGNVTVESRFEEGLPVLAGNARQLQQVFTSLILHAARSMPGGGRIALRTMRSGSTVQVEVADTGMGIPPEDRSRIFEPSFATAPAGEGTGLGLSAGYGIIRRHGGDILVESERGKGSVFTVVLPIPKPA